MPPPLLSRTLDPVLGVLTGVFAYHLYESHPRTAIPDELRLRELLKWKKAKWQRARDQALAGDAEEPFDWQAIVKDVEEKEPPK